jgi:hypothetical protein
VRTWAVLHLQKLWKIGRPSIYGPFDLLDGLMTLRVAPSLSSCAPPGWVWCVPTDSTQKSGFSKFCCNVSHNTDSSVAWQLRVSLADAGSVARPVGCRVARRHDRRPMGSADQAESARCRARPAMWPDVVRNR